MNASAKPFEMLTGQKAEQNGSLPRWLKGVCYALAAILFAFAILYASLATGLTNAALKAQLESRISQWSGLSVQSGGAVRLSFFPPKATLTDVKAKSLLPAVSVNAETLAVSFSFLSLIANNPVMNEVEVSGGDIQIDGGSLLRLQPLAGLDIAPGIVRFQTTKVSVLWPGGRKDEVSELAGTFRWTTPNGAARLSASGNWQGEAARFEGSSEEPKKLLSGSESTVSLQLKSAPLSFEYEGNIAFPGDMLAEGKLNARAPSINKVLGWMDVSAVMPSDQGALDIGANLSHADGKYTLNDLTMVFGGIPANGMLIIDPSPATLLVSGTLAFEKADLGSLVSAFQPAAQTGTGRNFDLDLRFSAETVQAASFELTDAAGTIKVSGSDTLLDLGSSRFAGGECVGSLKFSGPIGKREAAVKLSMRDVMADQLASYDPAFPILSAPLSAQLEASGEFYNWIQFIRQAVGTVNVTVGAGVARNFSSEALASLVSGGSVFALTDTYAGLSPVNSGSATANLRRGAAIITAADLQLSGHSLNFSGAIPLLSGGIALGGRITPAGDNATGLPFFIGGTWGRPFVNSAASPN